MNQELKSPVKWCYPFCCYAASFIALPLHATARHILVASSVNVLEQILMHLIMCRFLGSLTDRYLFRSVRFLQVLFSIALPFSIIMAVIGTAALSITSDDPFKTTLLTYAASHVAGNYLALYVYYVLRGFKWRHWPPQSYIRDVFIICSIEILLNVWTDYGTFKQAATVQIYPLLAYIAARYDQTYTALADLLVTVIVLVTVVLKHGPYYMADTASLSMFINLFVMLMYSACLTALLAFFMQQRRSALANVSRLKDELLIVSSQVSHDVRAPLTHVMSVCETLQRTSCTEVELEEVKYSCQTIADIMDSWLIILSESQEHATSTQENSSSATVTDITDRTAEETVTMLLRKIEVYGNRVILLSGKPLSLRTEQIDSSSQLFRFNSKMLQHVLINLVSNSVKYSYKGTISVTAAFQCESSKLIMLVKDEGIGISAEHLPYLFDRFYRIQQPGAVDTNTSFGVGLSIVQSLVTKMQGSIHVSSQLGVGSVFTVTVPCIAVDVIIPDIENQSAAAPVVEQLDVQQQSELLAKARVLVAEDNNLCSYLCTRYLAECASVKVIADGADVMAAMRQGGHNLVLLDGSLPSFSGQQIISTILQEIKTMKLVPAIVTISGNNSLLNKGSYDVLIIEHCNKPFSKQQLLDAVLRALQRQASNT